MKVAGRKILCFPVNVFLFNLCLESDGIEREFQLAHRIVIYELFNYLLLLLLIAFLIVLFLLRLLLLCLLATVLIIISLK